MVRFVATTGSEFRSEGLSTEEGFAGMCVQDVFAVTCSLTGFDGGGNNTQRSSRMILLFFMYHIFRGHTHTDSAVNSQRLFFFLNSAYISRQCELRVRGVRYI